MIKCTVLFCVTLIVGTYAAAQSIYTSASDSLHYYGSHYHPPQFASGIDSLQSFFRHNKHYPDSAREGNIEGRVIVRFLINEQGNATDIEIIRGINGDCDKEPIRLVAAMPPWIPATYKGRTVKAVEVLPVVFELE